jgi:hypothetical protein
VEVELARGAKGPGLLWQRQANVWWRRRRHAGWWRRRAWWDWRRRRHRRWRRASNLTLVAVVVGRVAARGSKRKRVGGVERMPGSGAGDGVGAIDTPASKVTACALVRFPHGSGASRQCAVRLGGRDDEGSGLAVHWEAAAVAACAAQAGSGIGDAAARKRRLGRRGRRTRLSRWRRRADDDANGRKGRERRRRRGWRRRRWRRARRRRRGRRRRSAR